MTAPTLHEWLAGVLDDEEARAREEIEQRFGGRNMAERADRAAHTLDVIAAHREIMALHPSRVAIWWPDDEACEVDVCQTCVTGEFDSDVEWPCPTLRALARAYRDRPGFREEWA